MVWFKSVSERGRDWFGTGGGVAGPACRGGGREVVTHQLTAQTALRHHVMCSACKPIAIGGQCIRNTEVGGVVSYREYPTYCY